MDSSTYLPDQKSPMVQLKTGAANANNQPVNYGPELWNVMKKVASDVGGAEYLVGMKQGSLKSTILTLRGFRPLFT